MATDFYATDKPPATALGLDVLVDRALREFARKYGALQAGDKVNITLENDGLQLDVTRAVPDGD